jgi:hypothetical protein
MAHQAAAAALTVRAVSLVVLVILVKAITAQMELKITTAEAEAVHRPLVLVALVVLELQVPLLELQLHTQQVVLLAAPLVEQTLAMAVVDQMLNLLTLAVQA